MFCSLVLMVLRIDCAAYGSYPRIHEHQHSLVQCLQLTEYLPPNTGNLYDLGLAEIARRGIRLLPQSLAEALGELRKDEVVQDSLGVIYDEFVELKTAEWSEYHAQVSSWEIDRYLTLF